MLKYAIALIIGIIVFYFSKILIRNTVQKLDKLAKDAGSRKFEPKKYMAELENNPKSKYALKIKQALAVISFIGGFCVTSDAVFGLMFGAAGYFFPGILIRRKIKKNRVKFEEQLVDALGILANCVRSGASLQQALEAAAKESSPPLSIEFSEVLSQIKLGVPLKEAMKNMAVRMNSKDLGITVLAVNIAKEYGGNLGENLFKISGTIRERKKIQNKIDAITSQGRMSAWIITCIPFLLLGVLNIMEPSLFGLMFKTLIG